MNLDKLKKYIKSLPETENIHGCDCIIYKGHECIFRESAGYSDAENTKPVSDTDRYILYSATKVITATLAMQCVEKGLFSLDDPIYKYLPEFENMKLTNGETAQNKITVKDLLTMQGGFSYDLSAPEIKSVINANSEATTAELVSAMAKMPLLFEPGTHFQYSLCHDVLARVIEVVCGKKYSDCAKEGIFEPLGMENSGFSFEEARPYLVQQYRYNGQTGENDIEKIECAYMLTPNYESGGAGLFSTVDDYGKFVEAMCNYGENKDGVRILSKESIDLMRKNHLGEESFNDFLLCNKPGYSYGLGVRTLIDKSKGSKSPIGEFGWDGAAGAYVMLDVENNIGVFYAQQLLVRDVANIIHTRIRNLIYED